MNDKPRSVPAGTSDLLHTAIAEDTYEAFRATFYPYGPSKAEFCLLDPLLQSRMLRAAQEQTMFGHRESLYLYDPIENDSATSSIIYIAKKSVDKLLLVRRYEVLLKTRRICGTCPPPPPPTYQWMRKVGNEFVPVGRSGDLVRECRLWEMQADFLLKFHQIKWFSLQ